MPGLRDVVLGGQDRLIRPDATENFVGSLDAGVILHLRTATLQPFGETGEGLLRRAYVQGYHRSRVQMFVTPVIDGRFRNDLTVYLNLPAPTTGRMDRFSLIAPFILEKQDFEGYAVAPKGTAFALHLEVRAPLARIYLTSAVPVLEPLGAVRSRGVHE